MSDKSPNLEQIGPQPPYAGRGITASCPIMRSCLTLGQIVHNQHIKNHTFTFGKEFRNDLVGGTRKVLKDKAKIFKGFSDPVPGT
jgi:hypothetical protein